MAFNPTYAGVGDNKLDIYGATPVSIWTIAFSSADTYVTGGLALACVTFGLTTLVSQPAAVEVIGTNTAGLGIVWQWNTTTGKLQAFVTGAASGSLLAELSSANTAIQSVTITVRVTVQR